MMKKIIMIIILLLLSGCYGGTIPLSVIKEGEEKCEINGGIKEIDIFKIAVYYDVHCNNGATFRIDSL
jgi:hypothetical protein